MEFPSPLIRGSLIKRYNRFLADILMEGGDTITAHCPNTGSMAGLLDKGNAVYLSYSSNPTRKLTHTLEIIEAEGTLVGVNTQTPNKLAQELFENRFFKEFENYDSIHREVKLSPSTRIDFALTAADLPTCYIEVKNVHYKVEKANGPTALFPDAITTRGQKHLSELSHLTQSGNRAVMLYIVQRSDIENFGFAELIDPEYAQLAQEAMSAGVEVIALTFKVTPKSITPWKRVPLL